MPLIAFILLAVFLLIPLSGLHRLTAYETTLPDFVGSENGLMTGTQREAALDALEAWVNTRKLSLGVLHVERSESSLFVRFWIGLTHLYLPPMRGIS